MKEMVLKVYHIDNPLLVEDMRFVRVQWQHMLSLADNILQLKPEKSVNLQQSR